MTKQVTEPVLEIRHGDGTYIRLWALNPGEWCQCSGARCHLFQARKTASLIYDANMVKAGGCHEASELNLRDKPTWDWISGLIKPEKLTELASV